MFLETKHTPPACKEILEDGKGEDSSKAVQNVVNKYASAMMSKQVLEATSTENQVLSSGPTHDMVVGDAISHEQVKAHTPLQIPVPRSAGVVTSEQGVEIASAVNHATHSPNLVAKSILDCMLVEDMSTNEEVETHKPVQIQAQKSPSAITYENAVNIASINMEGGKGEDSSKAVQNIVNKYTSAVTSKQVLEVTSTENQVLSSGPTDDMVVGDAISHEEVKVHTPLKIPVPRSAGVVTSEQGAEIAGTVNHATHSPNHVAKSILDCMLVEDMSTNEEVEMHKPVQIQAQKSSSAITYENAVKIATINNVFSGPIHIIKIVTNIGKTHVQSVDVGTQTDSLSECSPIFDTIMTPCMKRKLVEQDHSYCKRKQELQPTQPKCTTDHDVNDETEQDIDSSNDESESEIEEEGVDRDSDEDWIPEDEEVDSNEEEIDSDEEIVF